MANQVSYQTDVSVRVQPPRLYGVILHNDDYTTMDFVVDVLVQIFGKTPVEASGLMMRVHNSGSATVGVYSYDIAVSKKNQTERYAQEKGFPLRITIDEAME